MLIGNSMKGAVVAATRVAESVSDHRGEIEAGLALGMTTRVASRRFVRSALRTAISPQVEQTAALGIVFLPGAMTGLILAGVAPLEAVRAQLALMYVILAGVVIAATVTGLGTLGRLTTRDQRIVQLART
jgi:putative ABC transport system permease protein